MEFKTGTVLTLAKLAVSASVMVAPASATVKPGTPAGTTVLEIGLSAAYGAAVSTDYKAELDVKRGGVSQAIATVLGSAYSCANIAAVDKVVTCTLASPFTIHGGKLCRNTTSWQHACE